MDGPVTDPLIVGLAAADERAFAELYDRFGARLYRAALAMLDSRADAEDTVQEVFMGVLKSRRRLTDVQDLAAYLFAALRRAAGRCAARRARRPAASNTTSHEAIAPLDQRDVCIDPHGERLHRAIASLPAEQRQTLALKFDGELTFAQIAQVMGVSLNTAASRYRYALEKLRSSLGEDRGYG